MTITGTRIARKKEKKQKRSRLYTATMLGLSGFALVVTTILALILFDKYQRTVDWRFTSINGEYASIPAEFAKNNVSPDMIEDVNSLSNLSKLLDQVHQDNGLTHRNIDTAKNAVERADSILTKYNIESGESHKMNTELKLYIKLYDTEQTLYSNPNSAQLSELLSTFTNKLMEDDAKFKETDSKILERLNQISSDYNQLSNFITWLTQIVTIDGNTITVSSTMTSEQTDEMLEEIRTSNLSKFPNVKPIEKLLTSNKWNSAIKNNKTRSNQQAWNELVTKVNTLLVSNYIKVSDIKSYDDAVAMGLTVEGDDSRIGYEISKLSPVSHIMVNGNIAVDGYINRFADVVVHIKPTYESTRTSSSTSSSRVTIPSEIIRSSSSSSMSSTFEGETSISIPSETDTRTESSETP